jgi:fucose permease
MVLLGLGNTPSLVAGTLLVFAVGWSWPGLLMFAIVRLGRDSPAAASGIVQAGAFSGGAVGPALFGVLVAETSYPTSWFAAAGALVVSCTLLLCAWMMFRADLVRRPRAHGAVS